MSHYDSLYEEVSREEIETSIERVKRRIDDYREKERLIEEDLTHVIHEISRETLRDESDKIFKWRQSYERELAKLNNFLIRHNEGFRFCRIELY